MSHKYSVLIFEDDIDLANQWSEVFIQHNINVKHVWKIESVLAICAKMKFDAIICDIFIKNLTDYSREKGGILILSYFRIDSLKKIPNWGKTVPILSITGAPVVNGFDVLKLAKSMGSTAELRKPFTPQTLVETVINLIEDPKVDEDNTSAL